MSKALKFIRPRKFSVKCVTEIDSHIGTCDAHIVAYDPTDWYVDCITNKYDGEISGDSICEGLYLEIAEEVNDYFIIKGEQQNED